MTRDEERIVRFGLAMDLNYVAKQCGFSGISPDTWRWTQVHPLDGVEALRKQRWEYMQKRLQEQNFLCETSMS